MSNTGPETNKTQDENFINISLGSSPGPQGPSTTVEEMELNDKKEVVESEKAKNLKNVDGTKAEEAIDKEIKNRAEILSQEFEKLGLKEKPVEPSQPSRLGTLLSYIPFSSSTTKYQQHNDKFKRSKEILQNLLTSPKYKLAKSVHLKDGMLAGEIPPTKKELSEKEQVAQEGPKKFTIAFEHRQALDKNMQVKKLQVDDHVRNFEAHLNAKKYGGRFANEVERFEAEDRASERLKSKKSLVR